MAQIVRTWRLFAITLVFLFGSVGVGYCQTVSPPKQTVPVATVKSLSGDEFWDVLFIQGSKVGYTRTRVADVKDEGRDRIQFESDTTLQLTRFGQKNDQTISISSVETPTGELVRFSSVTTLGPTPSKTTGVVAAAADQLEITTDLGGKTDRTSLPWSPKYRGFFGVEQSLRERPLAPGESREFKTLVPILNQIAEVKLTAKQLEPTKLLDGQSYTLLRIETLTKFPDGNKMAETVWATDRGEVIKGHTDAMQKDSYRVSKSIALAEAPPGGFDLGRDALVKLGTPLKNAHRTKSVRYRVELENGDPAQVFANCGSQQTKPVGEHAAEVIVVGIRPTTTTLAKQAAAGPVDADRQPNPLIQSDDKRIVEMANKATDAKEPWEIAVALEKYVHDEIKSKNFSQAFATAAEVADSREGDCTEHAVLLAALLRAKGIPARVAIGLVYMEGTQAFGYHMWTEAYIGDRWIPLDATLGKGGIGGGHLKLLDSNLNGSSAYSTFLPVAEVLGRLKINVLDAE